jgi:hypothetical protein
MTHEELIDLLREARAALSHGCWNGSCCAVRARIDAALAEAPSPVTFLACPRCGHHMQHKPTGVVIDTLPPMTQIACVGCGLTRSIE